MTVPSLTRDERSAYGRLERKRCSRPSLAEVGTRATDPNGRQRVQAVIDQEADRVASLLPLRHQRMSASPFAFFRGSAVLMAADLGSAPSTRLFAQICGDAHAANFGIFGSPERRLVFDVNDFDETHRGPFEWDLKRLAVSLLLAGDDAGLPSSAGRSLVSTAMSAYDTHMHEYADMPTIEVWYARLDGATVGAHLDERRAAQVREAADTARSRSAVRALQKFVERDDDGRSRFKERPPRLQRVPGGPAAEQMLAAYVSTLPHEWAELVKRFRLHDLAFKAVGVGSVGTRSYVAVLDSGDPRDQLLIQLKEASRSVLAPYVPGPGPRHQGRRVVLGQKVMQAVGDVLLGWTRNPQTGRDFYIRQLWDLKGDLDLAALDSHGLQTHAMLCGWALARAHARGGDPVAIAAYLGGRGRVAEAVLEYAEAYTQVVRADYEAYRDVVGETPSLDDGPVDLPGLGASGS